MPSIEFVCEEGRKEEGRLDEIKSSLRSIRKATKNFNLNIESCRLMVKDIGAFSCKIQTLHKPNAAAKLLRSGLSHAI